MKLTNKDGETMVNVSTVEKKGDDLMIRAKIGGALTMTIYLAPEELAEGFKLLNWQLIKFLPGFVFKGWYRRRKLAAKNSRCLCFFQDCGSRIKAFRERLSGSD